MGKADKYNYGVVLDAGSSGTRVYVYRWLKPDIARQGNTQLLKSLPQLETKDKWTKKVHPGVSTYGENPGLVGPDHLQNLLNHALAHIPADAVQDTPIFLLATAGVRLLPEQQRISLLKNICSYIKTETKFLLPDCDLHVQVISGETEGLYGWIAANYLLGGFDAPEEHDHGKGHHTYGFLDMGGASAQIAFAPNSTEADKHANDLKLVRFRTVDGMAQEHRVFVTTWLGFGVHEARRRYLKVLLETFDSDKLLDPCLPPGYQTTLKPHDIEPAANAQAPERQVIGTGLFNECLKRTFPLLEKDVPCLDEPCLINGQHVPAIDFDVNHFIGISEYWHTTHEIFEMAHKDKSYDFQTYQSRVKEFCERPWSETQAEIADKVYGKKVDEQAAYEVCFKASWLINMLHDGIGVPRVGIEHTPVSHNGTKEVIESSKQKGYLDPFQAVNKIKSTEVSWTLGKMALYASANVPPTSIAEVDSYPVGFGSNVPGNPLPADFQYPGGGRLQDTPNPDQHSSPPSGSQSLTDTISAPFIKSDSTHRIPGLIFFLLIIIIAIFYLCGRDRRTRFFAKYLHLSPSPSSSMSLGKKPHHSSSKLAPFLNYIPFLRHSRTASADHDRSLEEGSSTRLYDPAEFELNDLNDSDTDSVVMPELAINGKSHMTTSGGGASSYASPTTNRSRTPRPKLTSSQSAKFARTGRLMPDAMDRRGFAVRTESRERLDLGGRRSRSGSLSPPRSRGTMDT